MESRQGAENRLGMESLQDTKDRTAETGGRYLTGKAAAGEGGVDDPAEKGAGELSWDYDILFTV